MELRQDVGPLCRLAEPSGNTASSRSRDVIDGVQPREAPWNKKCQDADQRAKGRRRDSIHDHERQQQIQRMDPSIVVVTMLEKTKSVTEIELSDYVECVPLQSALKFGGTEGLRQEGE